MTYSYEVPVSYTVDVALTTTPSGLAGYNTNTIAIFSNEECSFPENYIWALTPDTVKAAFGSNSLTYKMALALYTPVPNFKTGNGNLVIFKYGGANATFGTCTTASIASNVANFSSVSNGALKLTIDGTATQLTGLDFSAVTKIEDIVAVILGQNPDVYVSVVDTNKIQFKSKRPGGSVTIATSSTGTDIAGATYLNSVAATEVAGTNVSGETLSAAVATALQQVYFGGVLTTQYMDDTALLAASTGIQAQDVVFYNELQSLKDINGIGSSVKTAGNSKTRLLAYSMGAETAKIAIATYATIAQSVNFNASNTANTMNLKTLTGVLPDSNLSDTYVLDAHTNGVDIYGNTGGLACVYSNDNNGYTDDAVASLRLKKDMQVAGFNYLRQTNTKIPQTEQGLTGLKNTYALVCERFVTNGVVAPGEWKGSFPFGDPESFQNSINEKGYYIYSLPIAKQSQEDREARKAPVTQIALKFSGSFHFSQVIINVQR